MSPRLDHVGLSVGDLDRATAWYHEALGFDVDFAFRIPVLRGAVLVHPSGLRIELLERGGSGGGIGGSDPDTALLTRGWAHIALEVEDLDGTYPRLVEAGASGVWEPRQAPEPGARMAFVHDPDGNLIELIERGRGGALPEPELTDGGD
jgi:catechol 2,3-dioxygenase-like lactoylglutathione lyase family enzyme